MSKIFLAKAQHTHDAASGDIIGILPISRGGTGTDGTPTVLFEAENNDIITNTIMTEEAITLLKTGTAIIGGQTLTSSAINFVDVKIVKLGNRILGHVCVDVLSTIVVDDFGTCVYLLYGWLPRFVIASWKPFFAVREYEDNNIMRIDPVSGISIFNKFIVCGNSIAAGNIIEAYFEFDVTE